MRKFSVFQQFILDWNGPFAYTHECINWHTLCYYLKIKTAEILRIHMKLQLAYMGSDFNY